MYFLHPCDRMSKAIQNSLLQSHHVVPFLHDLLSFPCFRKHGVYQVSKEEWNILTEVFRFR